MIISLGRSRKDTKWRNTEISWEEFLDRVRSPKRTSETVREYSRMSKADREVAKDHGGFVGGPIKGGRRLGSAVQGHWLVTLDADQAESDMWESYACLYDYTCCVYSTHSHTTDKPRLRWVFPLTRMVTPEEYEPVARKLAQIIGIDCMDPTTYEVQRLMFWPTCPSDGAFFFREMCGRVCDPDALLRSYDPADPDAWRQAWRWPIGKAEQEVVRRDIKQQGEPTEKPGIIGLFCRTYDIDTAIEAFLPDRYEPCGENRYTYVGGTTAGGAVTYEHGAFLYSHHATDPCSGKLVNAFDLVRLHLFGDLDDQSRAQEVTRLPSYAKMAELAASDEQVKAQRYEESSAEFDDLISGGEDDENAGDCDENAAVESGADEADKGEREAADDWKKKIALNSKTGLPEPTIGNCKLILANAFGRGALAKNTMTDCPVIRQPLPWHRKVRDKRNGDRWTDADHAYLRWYMEQAWSIKSRNDILDAFDTVASDNAFHPVQEYLNGLEWDGTERLDTMLVRWFGASDSRFVRSVTRKWMCAAVKRAMEPGCKFDNILVLVGTQGIGKSRFGKLISRGWFTDSLSKMDTSKDALDRLDGVWIAELAELASAKRSEIDEIKNFISKQEDTYRKAYRRESSIYKRGCVFYGSTNNTEFLKDRTGERRWWPVECAGTGDHGRLTGFENEVDQLWAEAKYRLAEGEELWLTEDAEIAEAEDVWALHSVQDEEDELAGLVEVYLNTLLPEDWESRDKYQRRSYISGDRLGAEGTVQRLKVSIREIRSELLGEESTGRSESSYKLARVMGAMKGWRKCPKKVWCGIYGAQFVYERETAVFGNTGSGAGIGC